MTLAIGDTFFEMMLEVVMGVVDMEVDKVADEVNNMVDENGPIGRNLMNMYKVK